MSSKPEMYTGWVNALWIFMEWMANHSIYSKRQNGHRVENIQNISRTKLENPAIFFAVKCSHMDGKTQATCTFSEVHYCLMACVHIFRASHKFSYYLLSLCLRLYLLNFPTAINFSASG